MDKFRFRKEADNDWLTERVANDWSKISRHVDANAIQALEWRLDRFMDGREVDE